MLGFFTNGALPRFYCTNFQLLLVLRVVAFSFVCMSNAAHLDSGQVTDFAFAEHSTPLFKSVFFLKMHQIADLATHNVFALTNGVCFDYLA